MLTDECNSGFVYGSDKAMPDPVSFEQVLVNAIAEFEDLIQRNANRIAVIRCAKIAEITGETLGTTKERYADSIAARAAARLRQCVQDRLAETIADTLRAAVAEVTIEEQGK